MTGFTSIGALPSQYYPYSWTDLNIRPFTVAEMKLLSRALTTRRRRPVMDAVQQTIDQDVNELTVGDYYYVLAYHKLISVPQRPWVVEWTCQNEVWRRTDEDGRYTILNNPESTEGLEQVICVYPNAVPVQRPNISTVDLPEGEKIVLDPGFDWPRAAIIDDITAALLNPDLNLLVGAIQWYAGKTWEEKLKAFDASSMDDLIKAQSYNDVLTHGIVETLDVHCVRCGASHTHVIELDALTFFQ